MRRIGSRTRDATVWGLVFSLSLLVFVAACQYTDHRRREENPARREMRLDPGWGKAHQPWQPDKYPVLRVAYPQVLNAEYVNEDRLCQVCHKSHYDAFNNNVHRQHSCEACHGPASRHLETRGKEPGLILSFKRMKRAERAEVCARCHGDGACSPGGNWRTSAHAHHGVDCTQCHTKHHYNVPEGTPVVDVGDVSLLPYIETWKELLASGRLQDNDTNPHATVPTSSRPSAESTQVEELPGNGSKARQNLPSLKGTSNFLGAVVPDSCYRCHTDMYELEQVAHPHQVNGPHGFNCTTCHDTHGNVLKTTRKELCLQCHKDTTKAAWHSSIHDKVGVACTDCHDPHPNIHLQQLANITHTSIRRPKRLPMSVNEPEACYKCHPKIRGRTHLPSHHPIIEGKMTCSDCHDPHGSAEQNLAKETLNMLCYKCHADKQGPFVYEHPPVTEDCSICHEPHGTVTDNLLRQPAAFLCLRCHTGHRAPPADHFNIGTSDIDGNPSLRSAFYSDCTHCHSEVHGSDHPSQNRAGALLR